MPFINAFKKLFRSIFVVCLLAMPAIASAHEAYLIDEPQFASMVAGESPNPLSIILTERYEFALWAFACMLIVVLVLFLSLTKKIERVAAPLLFSLKKYAPLVARLTFGSCLIVSAYHGALFGPELPFKDLVGTYAGVVSSLFYLLGSLIILGVFVRVASIAVLAFFILGSVHYGAYLITYANYLGEILINFFLGAGAYSVTSMLRLNSSRFDDLFAQLEKYAFFFLRVLFGIAVIYAALYAKFLHSQLALDVVTDYHLTDYFHFAPLFVVLGAGIIEILIGLFFIIGFEIRFTVLVFLSFLVLSLSYFGEAVWPHVILIGVNLALFAHGYDELALESRLFRQEINLEPIL